MSARCKPSVPLETSSSTGLSFRASLLDVLEVKNLRPLNVARRKGREDLVAFVRAAMATECRRGIADVLSIGVYEGQACLNKIWCFMHDCLPMYIGSGFREHPRLENQKRCFRMISTNPKLSL